LRANFQKNLASKKNPAIHRKSNNRSPEMALLRRTFVGIDTNIKIGRRNKKRNCPVPCNISGG
jgi:hypothetical protein